MTSIRPLGLLFLVFRVSLGLVLLLATSALSALCVASSVLPLGLGNPCVGGLLALFFALQACAVWRILLFRRDGQCRRVLPFWFPPGGPPGPTAGALVPAPPRRGPPTLSAAAQIDLGDGRAA